MSGTRPGDRAVNTSVGKIKKRIGHDSTENPGAMKVGPRAA